jgi:hypothetical protein
MVAVPYRRIGTTYRSHLQGSNLKIGTMGCPEMSVRNNHYTLRNTPEEHRSQIQYFFAAIFPTLAHIVVNCAADQQAMKLTAIKRALIKL